jgi:hypothetical protein
MPEIQPIKIHYRADSWQAMLAAWLTPARRRTFVKIRANEFDEVDVDSVAFTFVPDGRAGTGEAAKDP